MYQKCTKLQYTGTANVIRHVLLCEVVHTLFCARAESFFGCHTIKRQPDSIRLSSHDSSVHDVLFRRRRRLKRQNLGNRTPFLLASKFFTRSRLRRPGRKLGRTCVSSLSSTTSLLFVKVVFSNVLPLSFMSCHSCDVYQPPHTSLG